MLRGALHENFQVVQVHGLLNEIESAVLHRRNRLFDRAKGGDQDDRDGRVGLFRFAKNLDSRPPGKLQVR